MNECPCCSETLLSYFSKKKSYWFCPKCRQEMPNLRSVINAQKNKENVAKLKLIYDLQDLQELSS